MYGLGLDRLVVLTYEQSHDRSPQPDGGPASMSENVIHYMREIEKD
ncbi:hypothetical protein [Bradyrhizobium sp. Arg816]|nr:hypothetical protein [Bradyrhizobium sp. Arg816]MDI3567227.1 hypothetical protein [Bradyrhizobium sp. Arg816]